MKPRTIQWHHQRIEKITEYLSITIRENLKGDRFQISFFVPTSEQALKSICAHASDAQNVHSHALQKEIPTGQGFVGAAYETCAPQAGNGGLRWNFQRDHRLRIASWDTKDHDKKRSYLALPVIELLPGIRTLTEATIWALLIFDDEEIADVETQAAFGGVQGQGG
ncbi:MAG: hypothetical protein ACFE0P_12470, partial [Oceanicaulis sp.]